MDHNTIYEHNLKIMNDEWAALVECSKQLNEKNVMECYFKLSNKHQLELLEALDPSNEKPSPATSKTGKKPA